MDAASCRLCGAALPDPGERCPTCGLHPARELSSATRWRIAGGLVAVYAVVAVILALAR